MDEIILRIRSGRRFLLTSHLKPDGDSIGSEMALVFILEQLGKEAVVFNHDPSPSAYHRLSGVERIQIGKSLDDASCDAVFVIECTELERCGYPCLKGQSVINIDHHSKNKMFGCLNWVETDACAVGEMIYDLALRLGVRLTADIATHLYVSIATDTGFFHFSNSSARAFEICAELTRAGANPAFVADALQDHNRPGQILLLGRCLARLQVNSELRTATIAMFLKDLEDIEIADGDTEGIINYPRSIDGVDVAVFYKEVGPRYYRVGLRSRGRLDVAEVAAEFGGGGHPQASGFSIDGDYAEVQERLIAVIKQKTLVQPTATGAGRG